MARVWGYTRTSKAYTRLQRLLFDLVDSPGLTFYCPRRSTILACEIRNLLYRWMWNLASFLVADDLGLRKMIYLQVLSYHVE